MPSAARTVGDLHRDGAFSEPYPSHDEALAAAKRATGDQRVGGADEEIEYEGGQGEWREERAAGEDRPETEVRD